MNDQEKRELLMKAAVQFKGKWPKFKDSDEEEWGEGEKGLAVCILDFFDDENYSVGDIGQVVISDCCKTVWLPFCSQKEFEAFMQELASKAPDGATHYLLTTTFNHYWTKGSDGFHPVQEIQGKSIVGPACRLNEVDLIPLPKREPAPWTPKVGQECEFSCTAKGKECEWRIGLIEYLSSSTCVINPYDAHGEFVAHPDTMKFRPMRTEAEIEREQLFKVVFDAVNTNGMTYYDKEVFGDFVSELIDAGVIK